MPVQAENASISSSERAHIDRVKRLLHISSQRLTSTLDGDEAVLARLPLPSSQAHPLARSALTSAMSCFFDNIERKAMLKAVASDAELKPCSRAYRIRLRLFADLLQEHSYLCTTSKRKHLLTSNDVELVLSAIWDASLPPLSILNLNFIITLEMETGLRPNEFSQIDDDLSIEPCNRPSAFNWLDVSLRYYGQFEQESSKGKVLDHYFFLSIEWTEGKKRKAGEFILTDLGSQPPIRAHHCPIRGLLAIDLWLGIFWGRARPNAPCNLVRRRSRCWGHTRESSTSGPQQWAGCYYSACPLQQDC